MQQQQASQSTITYTLTEKELDQIRGGLVSIRKVLEEHDRSIIRIDNSLMTYTTQIEQIRTNQDANQVQFGQLNQQLTRVNLQIESIIKSLAEQLPIGSQVIEMKFQLDSLKHLIEEQKQEERERDKRTATRMDNLRNGLIVGLVTILGSFLVTQIWPHTTYNHPNTLERKR